MTSYLDPHTLEEAMREIRQSRKTIESLRQQLAQAKAQQCTFPFPDSPHPCRAVNELRQQLAEWEKLKDPVTLHANLLRGIPSILSQEMLQHLMGNRFDAAIKQAKRNGWGMALEAVADSGMMSFGGDILRGLRSKGEELE